MFQLVKPAIFIFVLCFAPIAGASTPKIIAIQERPQVFSKELGLHLSYLPLDHFNTFFSVGLSYTHYFNSYFGWEVFNANYTQSAATGLEDYLIDNYLALPETFDVIDYYVMTGLVYTPLYMKHLVGGKKILWGDLSLVGGYGITRLERSGNTNTFSIGAMIRFFSYENLSYKFDLRQYFFASSQINPNLAISFGLTYNFGGKPKSGVLE